MGRTIESVSDIKESDRQQVIDTATNLGMEAAIEASGAKASAYSIATMCVEWIMDGVGDEVEAEDYFLREFNNR